MKQNYIKPEVLDCELFYDDVIFSDGGVSFGGGTDVIEETKERNDFGWEEF